MDSDPSAPANLPNVYDEIAYPSWSFPELHPDRIATPARLFGVPCAPPDACRVLEIACGEGASLIPAALGAPGAHFVGFDLAAEPVARGRALIEALGLSNAELFQGDILDVDLGDRTFDYIAAHGIYSWSPPAVREALMRLIRRRLAPAGVALISYNALPGCLPRQMLRQQLMFAARRGTTATERLALSMQRLRKLAATPPTTPFMSLVVEAATRELETPPEGIAHDVLSGDFNPFHLHEFDADCRAHGLRILTESNPREWRNWCYRPGGPVHEGLDLVDHAQKADFEAARQFRQMLLVRDDVAFDRRPTVERVRNLHAALSAQPVGPGQFEFEGGQFNIADPEMTSVLEGLASRWPATSPVADLHKTPAQLDIISALALGDVLTLSLCPAPVVSPPGARPAANPLARLQAGSGQLKVTSLLLAEVDLETPALGAFVSALDGTRTRDELVRDLEADGYPPVTAAEAVDSMLTGLAQSGLLSA
jgi:SAM-dependent methyltransferase